MPLKMPKNKNTSTTQRVLKNTFYNFWVTFASRIGGLVFTVIVARLLLPDLFGIYSLALTVILMISTFTDLGINVTLIRYLAESLKKPRGNTEARSQLYFLLNFKILLTAITSIALFLLSNVLALYVFKKPLLEMPLKIGAIYLLVTSLMGFFSSTFYALQKIKYNVLAETIFQILRIALVLVFFMFYKNVEVVFVALSIAYFVSFIFLYFTLLKKHRFLLKGKKSRIEPQEKRRLLGFFGWMTISSISIVFFLNIDNFMVGMFLPSEFMGFYSVIFSIVWAIAAFATFSLMLLPVFTQLESGKLEQGFKKVFHYVSIIAIPVAIGLAFIMVPLIRIVYGSAYVPQQYRLAIAITSAIISMLVVEGVFSGIYSTLFQAKEKPKIPAILIMIATVANIILNYIFIKIGISIAPQYGLVAVAIATTLIQYSYLIALVVLAGKKLNIRTSASSIIKPLIASAIMLGFLFAFHHFVRLNIWIGILMIVLAALVYFGVMWMIKGIKKEDFNVITLLFKR